MEKINVLFVCLGNICRSPMAEGAFRYWVDEAELNDRFGIDSAGTSGWHEGEKADRRMRSTAESHGITLTSRSRQIRPEDFHEFHYILPMDRSNERDIQREMGFITNPTAKILMMREFDNERDMIDVPDPYYGGDQGFEDVYQMMMRSTRNFLDFLNKEHFS